MTARKRELLVRTLRLEVVSGPDRGKSIDSAHEIVVGTDAASSLVLSDSTVSRMHVAIAPAPVGWILRDLGSTNGTEVAGVRVYEAVIAPGQTIAIGNTAIAVSDPGAVEIRPLSEDTSWGRALGKSAAMRELFAVLPRIASSDAVVLLEGETGTGKTLLADAIHRASARHRGPFVVVDCAAIAPTLVESDLFGHEKGSFTGAHAQRHGAFELATGGTLFLDEIGELPLELQPKLLRVLEDGTLRRVGGSATIQVDVRVIAATNRELRREVNRHTFRSDLFYRIATIRLRVPPLRDRLEDIALLAEHFWSELATPDQGRLPDALLDELLRRDWPGNVRELRSAVERAVLLGDPGDESPAEPAPAIAIVDGKPFRTVKEQAVARWERAYVRALVDRHGGNLSAAARAARMDRNHLRELLHKHWAERPDDD
jgi:two-component system, NtrC family, response regulator GlrR